MGVFSFGGEIRIYFELPQRCCTSGEEEDEVGKLHEATEVVAGAINLGRYGVANCRREGDITARWRATESTKLSHRLRDIGGGIGQFVFFLQNTVRKGCYFANVIFCSLAKDTDRCT